MPDLTKKVLEDRIKMIHWISYDYPEDWALTDEEYAKLLPLIQDNIAKNKHRITSDDADGWLALNGAINDIVRIDSSTMRLIYSGYAFKVRSRVYRYENESDALSKLFELTGEQLDNFEIACERWNIVDAQPLTLKNIKQSINTIIFPSRFNIS